MSKTSLALFNRALSVSQPRIPEQWGQGRVITLQSSQSANQAKPTHPHPNSLSFSRLTPRTSTLHGLGQNIPMTRTRLSMEVQTQTTQIHECEHLSNSFKKYSFQNFQKFLNVKWSAMACLDSEVCFFNVLWSYEANVHEKLYEHMHPD